MRLQTSCVIEHEDEDNNKDKIEAQVGAKGRVSPHGVDPENVPLDPYVAPITFKHLEDDTMCLCFDNVNIILVMVLWHILVLC